MMACPDESRLSDLVDGLLAPAEVRALDLHLDACPSCRRVVSELGKLAALEQPSRRTRIGRYELGDVIAAGGMGVVHAAFDPMLGRTIAIKILDRRPDDRAYAEARALARVRHPGVVAIHDVGVADGRVFIAMEYVPGVPLDVWARGGRSWREIVDVMIAAARGLAAIHASGLIHGDVKPSNLLVADDGRVQVIDFGLAALAPEVDHVATGGTPSYLAPERLAGEPPSCAADQYSFCVTFDALRPTGTVPREVERAIAQGRQRDPASRHADMATLLVKLERARRRRLRGMAPALAIIVGALATAATDVPHRTSAATEQSPFGLEHALREPRLGDLLAPMLFGADATPPGSLAELERAAIAAVAAASRRCISSEIADATIAYRARDCEISGYQLSGEILAHYDGTARVTVDTSHLVLAGARIDAHLVATRERDGRVMIDVRQIGRGPLGHKLDASRHLVRALDGDGCTTIDARWSFVVRGTRWTGAAGGVRSCPGQATSVRALEFTSDASSAVVHASIEPGGALHWSSSPRS